MEFWSKIEECLWDEGLDVLNENGSIIWESPKGLEHIIRYRDVAYDGNKLAWYQDEEFGRCLVRIQYTNGIVLSWRPESSHPDWGFTVHYIKWFGDRLIVIYREKHTIYVVKIENLTITVLYQGGISYIQMVKDIIYIQNWDNKDFVHQIQLNPESTLLNCLPISILKKRTIAVELESFDSYFGKLKLNGEYNKRSQ